MSHFFDDGPTTPTSPPPHTPVEFDALADLFLGDEETPALRLTSEPTQARASEPAPSPPRETPLDRTVDALILGHLPVLAGAWAAQHARSLAEENARPVALARFAGSSATLQVMGPRDALAETHESETVDEACEQAVGIAPTWCMRVDAPDELDLAAHPDVARITLLTGADDAAVVAAYRTLKGLCDLSPDDDAPEIAVRVMGAPLEDAAEVEDKIRRVTRAFLDRDLVFLPPAPQIHAGAGRTLYRGETEIGFAQLLASLPSADSQPSEPVEIPPEPEQETAQSLAEILELVPLEIRCPVAPTIEFARDEAGRLHLLGLGADAAEDLLAAEGWARTNASIVLRAADLDARAEIIVRVLTATPARDRRLLDARFRVDLLHEVRVGDQSAWCCVPLNTDE